MDAAKILIGCTGSVASVKIVNLVQQLRLLFNEVIRILFKTDLFQK